MRKFAVVLTAGALAFGAAAPAASATEAKPKPPKAGKWDVSKAKPAKAKASGTYQVKAKRVRVDGTLLDTVKDTKNPTAKKSVKTFATIQFFTKVGKRYVPLKTRVFVSNDKAAKIKFVTAAKNIYAVKTFTTITTIGKMKPKKVVQVSKPLLIKK